MSRGKYLLVWVLLLLSLAIIVITSRAASPAALQVSFIDVGQGDSALIRDDSGFDLLIDGGKPAAGPTVVAYLREQSLDDLDAIVVSHADSDHVGGLINVLQAMDIPIEKVYYNGYAGTTVIWSNFEAAVAARGLALEALQFPLELPLGDSTAYILNPLPGLDNPETNDASVVILLAHPDARLLFPGDIDNVVEAKILVRGTPVAADLLKVTHHGSAYGSSSEFLAAVQPVDAVISVGENSYGHPNQETIDRLVTAGATIWRTDLEGTILLLRGEPQLNEYQAFIPMLFCQGAQGDDGY